MNGFLSLHRIVVVDAAIDDDEKEEKKSDATTKVMEYEWSTHKTIGYGRPKGHTVTKDKIAGFDMVIHPQASQPA